MKYLKMLGLTAVAAMAVMAFVGAGTASASKICSTTTDPCTSPWANGTVIDFSLAESATLETNPTSGEPIVLDTCTGGTVKGSLEQGTATATAKGTVTAANLQWSGCTFTTDTITGGTLEIHKISGTSNGTVTASGFTVTVNTGLFGSCTFITGNAKDLGESKEGINPSMTINTLVTRETGLCPAEVRWTAKYTLTEPAATTFSVSAS
jgi:hypothetical protein